MRWCQRQSDVRQMRVLAAEDNKTNQLVFRKMVKHLDIELAFANDGVEAVEKQASFAPDLIFMDLVMPVMTTCRLIAGLPCPRVRPNTPRCRHRGPTRPSP